MRSVHLFVGFAAALVAGVSIAACGQGPAEDEAPAAAAAGSGAIPIEISPGDRRQVDEWLAAHLEELLETYRHLHSHTELSLEEAETAALLAAGLRSAGFQVTEGVGGHGVVAVLANGSGPTLLIRGDMDALPVAEDTGLSYASAVRATRPDGTRVGVMHACGHDVHVASLLGTARLLSGARDAWSGTLLIVGQPAEELGRGALMMLEDGLFERFPRPDYALALHVDATLPAGQLGAVSGWSNANVDSVNVTLYGRGGHGAQPHTTVDPIVAAAHVITALQTLVSRRVNPADPAVVTVGAIHGGTKHNVIPDEVEMQLTVRSYSDEVRELLLDGIRQIVTDTCQTFGCPKPPEIGIKDHYTPAVYNDPELTRAALRVFESVFGESALAAVRPTMGGEDFGRYGRELGIPSLLFRLGSVAPARYAASLEPGGPPLPSLHSGRYHPDPEPTLRTGIQSTSQVALALLRRR
jgi:amidohydrolase